MAARRHMPEPKAGRWPQSPSGADQRRGFEQAVLAATLDPIVTVDAAGVVRSASDSIECVLGWPPAELVGRNISVLMPEPHRSAHDGYMSAYHRHGTSVVLGRRREFQAVRKDGSLVRIELCVSRADLPGQTSPVFVGMIRDVTVQNSAEQSVRLMQTLMLDISAAESVSDALTGALREIAAATGWDYGEFWLHTPRSRTSVAQPELTRAACWPQSESRFAFLRRAHAFPLGTNGVVASSRRTKAPPVAWIEGIERLSARELALAPTAASAGVKALAAIPVCCEEDPVAILLFFVCNPRPEHERLLDITRAAVAPLGQLIRRKRAEEELARHDLQLARLVQERTAELEHTHAQLRMTDRLASIGTLAAGLGHDMNNVLLPVRARLRALSAAAAGGRLPAQARRHVEAIHKSVAYLQQLADGLHFLAMDPEADEDGVQTTSLRDWWSKVGPLISRAVPKHVQVTTSIPAKLPEVAAASHRLTQAMLNLVVNAGEAIPFRSSQRRGRGRVRIWAKADTDPAFVQLGVTDNGRGMTDEVKRRAFEMFFTTKSRGLGTGLGLPLVQKVAAGAGGRVSIESRPGHGTTVTMTLRAAQTGTRGAGTVARITVPDGRAAAIISQILEAGGATVTQADRPSATDIWVVDPDVTDVRDVRAWRKRCPASRLVLLGKPTGRGAGAWRLLEPIIIDTRNDLDAVRFALITAMNGS